MNAVRPCPWVSCRHHLGLDVAEKTGTVKRNGEPGEWDPEETCALDVADRGPETLEEVGRVMGLTRERVRQIEELAFAKMRKAAGVGEEDGDEVDEEKLEAIRDMFSGVEASGFVSAPLQSEPTGAEEGPQGTFVVPDRIEPAEGVRRMFHKTMDAHLRDRAEEEAKRRGLPPPHHNVRVMPSTDSSDSDDGDPDADRSEASQRARRGKRTALPAWRKKDRAQVEEWLTKVRFVYPREAVRDASGEVVGYREYVPPSDRPPLMTPGFGPPDDVEADDGADSGVFTVKKPKRRAKKPRRARRQDGTKPGFGSAENAVDDGEMLLDLLDF